MLILPYEEKQGECSLRSINTEINCNLPKNKRAHVIYTGTKLGSTFNTNDIIKKEHQQDLINSVF